MYFGTDNVYSYLGDFLKKRVGEEKLTQEMLDRSINILADYYTQIESHNLNENDKNKYRLSAIDALLELTGSLKNNINRKFAAWEILPKYENDEEVKNFESWLCPPKSENELEAACSEIIVKIEDIIVGVNSLTKFYSLKYNDPLAQKLLAIEIRYKNFLDYLDQNVLTN